MRRLLILAAAAATLGLLAFGAGGCSSLPGNAGNASYWQ